MKDNIILDKSFDFAVRIVKLYKHLCDDKKEYVLSKQLLRSGTSIGANINEAQAGQSKAIEAGLDTMAIVTGRGKRAIEDHFDRSYELENQIDGTSKESLMHEIRKIVNDYTFSYTRQAKQGKVLAYKFEGSRFDCGSVDGFVEATNYFYKKSES